MKKQQLFIIVFIALIFFIQVAKADDCGITNLASCIPEKIFEFFLSVLNAPLQPLLDWIHSLMVEPVNPSLFSGIWSIITYILSLFYGLILIFIGFKFLFSGYSPEQRDSAKKSLRDIILMIVLIQSSYILYCAGLELSGALTGAIFKMIDPDFFLFTISGIPNIFLQFILEIPYIINMILTLVLLALRYILVICGVALFPIGIFCYLIEPLQSYGKLILNILLVVAIIPFFYAIIFLASSMLIGLPVFANMKIILMIASFTLVNFGTLIGLAFVIINAALKVITPVMKVAGVVAKVAAL
ncbi:MAG: hypothetical protein NTX24_00610 [Candidatus Pacearchaeota archaeon]|nr:hypothetical protein [Candidatus Pacearchaeota archaeon]